MRPKLFTLVFVLWALLASIDGRKRSPDDARDDDFERQIGDEIGYRNEAQDERDRRDDLIEKELVSYVQIPNSERVEEGNDADESGSDDCIDFDQATGCYTNDFSNRSTLYGSKTTYAHAQSRFQKKYGHNITIDPECQPIAMYLIARHTIRFPGATTLGEFEKYAASLQRRLLSAAKSPLAASRNGTMCREDYRLLSKWRYNWKQSDADRVTKSGFSQTMELGMRFKQQYPRLLDPSSADIKVYITDKVRTNTTATAFLDGIGDSTCKLALYQKRLIGEFVIDTDCLV